MGATTTAVFTAVGISATDLTTFLSTVFGQAVHFMIYVFETVWPYLLVLGLIGVIIGIAFAALRLGRRA